MRKDITNIVFSRLTAIKPVELRRGIWHWLCKCECGKETIVGISQLINGDTKSCGCYKNELIAERSRTHGGSHNKIPGYYTWKNIKARCYNKNNTRYENYGERGIGMCDRWRNSFENFISDMGAKPSKSHSIERIDNNKDYCPENCKWATPLEQANNTTRTLRVSHLGKIISLYEVCKIYGISQSQVRNKSHNHGITIQQALEYFLPKSNFIPHSFGHINATT